MKKRFLAIFIIILMLFSQTAIFASESNANQNSINPEDKLTEELKDAMNNVNDDEYISVYIWLNDTYGDELVYLHLSNKLGQNINNDTEESYINQQINNNAIKWEKSFSTENELLNFEAMTVESKAETLRNNANISNIISNDELISSLNEGKTHREIIEISERYQYLSDYRDSRVAVNQGINERFYDVIDVEKCQNIMVDSLLPYIEMDCKKEYILTLASKNETKEIGILIASDIELMEETEAATTTTDDKYILGPLNTIYKGTGIKVGVFEKTGYDADADHLEGANITPMSTYTGTATGHATAVLSILCGQLKTMDQVEYQGIAPDITAFFVNGLHMDMREFYWLIVEKDVAIINISQHIGIGTLSYNERYERFMDCLVKQYKVTIVTAAGNETNIISPGMGYNLITVGNMSNTKDSNGKYIINANSSSYEEIPYLTNKPDITAFGTNVHMIYGGQEHNFGTGTSFATPMVTGTVALMMEANPKLISSPNSVKTLLMSTADQNVSPNNDNVIVSGTPTVTQNGAIGIATGILREKSGAGLLKPLQAIAAAIRYDYHEYDFPATRNSIITNEYYFRSGDEIEIAMVFDKASDELLERVNPVNFDIQIISITYDEITGEMQQTIHFNSFSTQTQQLLPSDTQLYRLSEVNNAELYKITFATSGYYHFKIVQTFDEENEEFVVGTNPFDELAHLQHNSTTVSLAITCGCSNKNIESMYNSNSRITFCNNCGAGHNEQVSICNATKPITYGGENCGYLEFSLYYRVGYIDDVSAIILNVFSTNIIANENLGYELIVRGNGSNTVYTAVGYNQTMNYEVLIIKNNNLISSYYFSSTIVYDYMFENTATLTVN